MKVGIVVVNLLLEGGMTVGDPLTIVAALRWSAGVAFRLRLDVVNLSPAGSAGGGLLNDLSSAM
jgi:hypothetical protein